VKVAFSDTQLRHAPPEILSSGKPVPSPEIPARAERLLAAAIAAGHQHEVPESYGIGPIAAIHTARYLAFLEKIFIRWQRIPDASREVFPNIHPPARNSLYPASAVGQVGYHVFDGGCPITADTWDSACWSAWSAVHAAYDVLDGAVASYALCRPPGHHAGSDLVGGFCYFNNAAIAAQVLRGEHERVAILDVDVHHGNGTQDIFYARDDVFTVSLHADPVRFYPFFWGAADERGRGEGDGYNLNLPLLRGTGGDDYLAALDRALRAIEEFDPGALVVALGLDAFVGDPLAGLGLTTADFGRVGKRIASLGLPTALVQEGGYPSDELGDNLVAVLGAFAA
jgi:acetoin utilization deacetylase AcuC-like enzyme